MSVETTDLRLIPGGLQDQRTREIPGLGLVEFEFAPAGWLTQKGEPRWKDWRAYYFTPEGGKRLRVPSVTTVLDAIMPKPGLVPWSEAKGIEGAVEAVRLGEINPVDPASAQNAVATVRSLRLGADRARDVAASRGLNVHACLEEYARTGSPPNPADHPGEHAGYLRALTRWLLHADPEPVTIEELVCHPQDGYAGRLDLRARIGGLLTTVDAKSQERGSIYESAHLQVRLYERAEVQCGGEEASQLLVVVFGADGEFREMHCTVDDATATAALAYYRAMKPTVSACQSANRAAR